MDKKRRGQVGDKKEGGIREGLDRHNLAQLAGPVSRSRDNPVHRQNHPEKNKLVQDLSLHLKRVFELEDLSPLLVSEITSDHVQSYLMEQATPRSNNSANRDRKNLMAMWSWGEKILDLPLNPIAKIPKFRHSRSAQYVPPEGDMLKILAVATARERAFLDCYLCAGARRSEIFNLTWDMVNFEHRMITLSTKKTADGSEKSLVLPMIKSFTIPLNGSGTIGNSRTAPFCMGDRGRPLCWSTIRLST